MGNNEQKTLLSLIDETEIKFPFVKEFILEIYEMQLKYGKNVNYAYKEKYEEEIKKYAEKLLKI